MSSRRTVILIAAIVIGAVAAFALFQYVDGIEDRAYDNARRVEVFVVKQDIAKGLPGEDAIGQEFIQADEIPQEFRPSTALTDIEAIRGKVALNNLSAGQVVVDGMFVDPRAAFVSFSQRITTGRVAITISTDQVRGVANLIVPGDKVNMIVDDITAGPAAEGQTPKRFLYQNVEVLAIGNVAAPEAGETQAPEAVSSGLLTLSVPPIAAERIAFVGSENIYLTLVPPDYQPAPVPPVGPSNLFSDELTPYPDEEL